MLSIPEESRVPLMRGDVVDYCGRGYPPFLLAPDAQWLVHQVGLAGVLSAGVVAALSG
jgi:hypothetical protein